MRFGTELVDTHCHLADYSDPVGVLRDATAANVHIVAVTRTPTEYRTLRTRLGSRPGVTVALGMHPQQPEAATQTALARFFQLAPNAAFLGEVGLDFTDADTAAKRAQRRTFDAVCDELSARPRPVTVHSRGARKRPSSRYGRPRSLRSWTGSPAP